MGIFDRFRRDKSQPITADDEVEYFQGDQSNRRSAALLLGVVTFVATLLIGSALFFGGRAVYRAVFEDDGSNNTSDTAQVQTSDNKQAQPAENQDDSSNSPSDGEDGTDGQPGDDGTSSSNTNGSSSEASSSPSIGDNIPNTGDQTTLPATGDPGL